MTTFLDTNIVIALLDEKHPHHPWSVEELVKRKTEGPAVISDVVYCEVSVGMKDKSEVDEAMNQLGLERIRGRDEALVRAGTAFKQYKEKNNGPKTGVLPDFIIGSIAEVEEAPLMTVNEKDFTGYFPDVELICPPKAVAAKAE
jgi:predicted nucleic acid-binding protein